MRRIAYLVFSVLVCGCAGTTDISQPEPASSDAVSQWVPPAGRTELQVKRDRSECQLRGVSGADMCLQSLGYSKK